MRGARPCCVCFLCARRCWHVRAGRCAGPARQLRPNPDRGNGDRRAPALAKVVVRPPWPHHGRRPHDDFDARDRRHAGSAHRSDGARRPRCVGTSAMHNFRYQRSSSITPKALVESTRGAGESGPLALPRRGASSFVGSCRPVEVRSAEAYPGALRPSSRPPQGRAAAPLAESPPAVRSAT